MAEQFLKLDEKHRNFIENQQMFFVATAGPEGRINLSPKGLDSLRIISDNQVAWLNLTGSGNESAAHIKLNPRMTLMFCSFDKQPLIMRLYGTARAVHQHDEEWSQQISRFPAYTAARQVFIQDIDLVQTSCGFAVPFYEFRSTRETLNNWADKQGQSGIRDYWKKNNRVSLDGFPTGLDTD